MLSKISGMDAMSLPALSPPDAGAPPSTAR